MSHHDEYTTTFFVQEVGSRPPRVVLNHQLALCCCHCMTQVTAAGSRRRRAAAAIENVHHDYRHNMFKSLIATNHTQSKKQLNPDEPPQFWMLAAEMVIVRGAQH